jgi:hypothetical protein
MNKYFLLLITSFASLSLNAAEGQGYQYKSQELKFVEKGTVKGGEQFGARILADQEWYKFTTTDGKSYFVQHKEGGKDVATGRDTGVNGTSVIITNPDGQQVTIQTKNPHLKTFSLYDAFKYLNFCRKNAARFPVVAATK